MTVAVVTHAYSNQYSCTSTYTSVCQHWCNDIPLLNEMNNISGTCCSAAWCSKLWSCLLQSLNRRLSCTGWTCHCKPITGPDKDVMSCNPPLAVAAAVSLSLRSSTRRSLRSVSFLRRSSRSELLVHSCSLVLVSFCNLQIKH